MRGWLAWLLAALWTLPAQADVSTLWSVVMLSGSVQPGDHERLVRELDARRPRSLLIGAIGGGDVTEARRIGEEIARRQLPLELSGVCFSPCAEQIFLRAKQRKLGRKAFVVFAPMALAELLAHGEEAEAAGKQSFIEPALMPKLRDALQAETELRERLPAWGMATELLAFPARLLKPRLRGLLSAGDERATVDFDLPTRCQLWAPPASVLRELGVVVGAERDASLKDFPRLKQFSPDRVYDGPPVSAEAQTGLCQPAG